MRTFAVNIPTKSYLRKYIHKRYGHPVRVDNCTFFGSVLVAFLNKRWYCDRSNAADLQRTYSSFNSKVECVIPQNEVFFGPFGLTLEAANVIMINRYFANAFEEELYDYCQSKVTGGKYPGYMQCLYSFAEKYDLEFDVDITYEALKKMEYRFRKKMEENLTADVPSFVSAQPTLF